MYLIILKLIFKKYSFQKNHLLWLFLILSFNSFSQVSENINRNSSPSAATNLVDSATRSIELMPNFLWDANDFGTLYSAKIVQEIFVEWPKPGQVVQRNNSNVAPLQIKGHCSDLDVDSVKVTVSVIEGGAAKSKNFFVDAEGKFSGTIDLNGGDYLVTVSDYYYQGLLVLNPQYTCEISRVGIGEVILLWGHSFMEGPNNLPGQAAVSERARTIKTFIFQEDNYYQYFQNLEEMPFEFKKIDENSVGPFAKTSWIAGIIADSLVNRLDVPVLMYSTAFGGSNIYQNRQNITNQPFGYTWFGNGSWQNNGFPFKALQASFSKYIPHTGVRGVVVHHGSNDVNNASNGGNYNDFQSNYEFVLNRIRTVEAYNNTDLAFVINVEGQDSNVLNPQIENIINNDPNIHLGVDLRDPSTLGPWREFGNGGGHFEGQAGLEKYAELWTDVLTVPLINSMTPIMTSFNY